MSFRIPGLRFLRSNSSDSPLHKGPRGTFIFVHINKTAGTSIGTAIGLRKKQHLTVKEIIPIVGRSSWKKAFRFAFVRNPWARVVSQYNHRIRTNQTTMGDKPIPFGEWVAHVHGPELSPLYYDSPKFFQTQAEWLRDDRGEIDIDYIGRFETLAESFKQVTEKLGIAVDLPHLNATAPTDYRTFYDDRSAELVGKWFADDCRLFDYRFDSV
jgi:hypothetical protein